MVREIHVDVVRDTVCSLCMKANYYVGADILDAFEKGREKEEGLAKDILDSLLENAAIAKNEQVAICQDTGMVVVFMEIGQDVHFVGGNLDASIQEGVRNGYEKGYLRKSVLRNPIIRVNTNDNTPAVIHYEIVAGEQVRMIVAPKGFGSENMSALRMLKPSEGLDGVMDFVVNTVKMAGANPCPPIIVGVGIGGTMEKAAIMAKKALTRDIRVRHTEDTIAKIEEELLERINQLGIGPAGFGGKTTALAVLVEMFATHIAGLPVAVNIGCHVTRHIETII